MFMQTWLDNAWLISLMSASLCLAAAIQLWRYRDTWSVKSLIVTMLSLCLWALGYGMALKATNAQAVGIWVGVEMTGVAGVPAGMALLALSYSPWAARINRRLVGWLFLLPALTAVLTWTNGYHHLIFGPFDFAQGGGVLRPDFKMGFWVLYLLYPYLLLSLCVVSLFLSLFRAEGQQKSQLLLIILGFSLPTLCVFFYHTSLIGQQIPDPTAASFAFATLLTFYAQIRYRSPQTVAMETSGQATELNFKVQVVRVLNVLLLPTFTYFIGSNFSAGWIFPGVLNVLCLGTIIVFSLLIVNASSLTTIEWLFRTGTIIFVGLFWILCVYFLSYDFSSGTILWSLVMPLVCLLAFGSSWGLILSLMYQAVSMAVSWHLGKLYTIYFSSFGVRYTVVYLVLSISLFYMDKKRREFLRQTVRQRDSLLESHRRYRLATEYGSVGVWEMDAAGRQINIDQNILKVLGLPPNHRPTSLAELLMLCPKSQRLQTRRCWRALSQGLEERASFEMSLLHRDGKPRWFLVRGQTPEGQNLNQGPLYGTITEITERKQAEKEKGLLENQLRHSQKMEALGTLAGGIAHEFNNLLAAILGFAELAQEETGDQPETRENLDQIIAASRRAQDLIGQMLTFSRKSPPVLRPLEVNSEILTGQRMLQRLLPRTVIFKIDLDPDLKTIEASADHINQLLINLVSNAAHAMPDGGKLEISTQNVRARDLPCPTCGETLEGDYVLLRVSDTGHGMDQETLRRILEPFFTTKEVGEGTGLGLSVVHGIIRSYQGHLICQSQKGQGSTFLVYLPAYQGGEDISPQVEGDQGALPGGDETILWVDDEKVLREMGGKALGKAGYKVFTAASGEEALEIFNRHGAQIDLVALDLGMPGMGGQKCLRALRELKPKLKVIVLSGYTFGEHRQDALRAGAAAFLNKPTPKAELLRTVRRVLDT